MKPRNKNKNKTHRRAPNKPTIEQQSTKNIVILYSSGGLGDVGRHVIQAALDTDPTIISHITILTSDPSTLEHPRWNCGCSKDHHIYTKENRNRFEVVTIDVTNDNLSDYLRGASAVISCLGNRQPFWGDEVGKEGTENIVRSMFDVGMERLVVISSVGIDDDWPPAEFTWLGYIMEGLFLRTNYHDLLGVEQAAKCTRSNCLKPLIGNGYSGDEHDNHVNNIKEEEVLDYLIVRPLGLGEDVIPEGKWYVNKMNGEEPLGDNMAKLDCARFMLQEALNPTLHRTSVVIGGKPDNEMCESENRD